MNKFINLSFPHPSHYFLIIFYSFSSSISYVDILYITQIRRESQGENAGKINEAPKMRGATILLEANRK